MSPDEFEAKLAGALLVELREAIAQAWMKHPQWEWAAGWMAVDEDGNRLRVIAVEGEFLLLCKPIEGERAAWDNERRYAPDAFDVGTASSITAALSRAGGAL